MKFSNRAYDVLKYVALILLPAVAVLVLGLGHLWGWSNVAAWVATITLVDTFLGALLQLSSRQYNNNDANFDGFLMANGRHEDTGLPNLQMNITKGPDELLQGKHVRLKVKSVSD